MQEYFDKIDAKYAMARSLRLPEMAEKWKIHWIIATMPDEIDTVFSRMTLREEVDFDIENIKTQILSEEQRQQRNQKEEKYKEK